MSDEEREEFEKLLKEAFGLPDKYPPELKTATKAEFVTGTRKIRRPLSPIAFWTLAIMSCLLFWTGLIWLLSLVF